MSEGMSASAEVARVSDAMTASAEVAPVSDAMTASAEVARVSDAMTASAEVASASDAMHRFLGADTRLKSTTSSLVESSEVAFARYAAESDHRSVRSMAVGHFSLCSEQDSPDLRAQAAVWAVFNTRPRIDAWAVPTTRPRIDAGAVSNTRPRIDARTISTTRPRIDARTISTTRPRIDGLRVLESLRGVRTSRPGEPSKPQVWREAAHG